MGKLQYLYQTAAGVRMALRSSVGMVRKYRWSLARIAVIGKSWVILQTTTGISSDVVCDVLVQSMEKRFGAISYLPQPVE